MYKRIEDYMKEHSNYSALVHAVIGIGLGVLITYPLVGSHPLRWGAGLLTVGVLAHLYPLVVKR